MKNIFLLLITAFLINCSPKQNDENQNSVEQVSESGTTENTGETTSNEVSPDIITNNTTAGDKVAQNAEPKFQFKETEFDFGTIIEGEKVSHTFTFTNIGNADLVITSASASCGCTVPKHSKEPIPPGKTGQIEVTFDSANKGSGVPITKDVTIIANTNPVQTILQIKAIVNKK